VPGDASYEKPDSGRVGAGGCLLRHVGRGHVRGEVEGVIVQVLVGAAVGKTFPAGGVGAWVMARGRMFLFVNLGSIGDADDENDQLRVLDLAHDSVIAHSVSP